MSNAEYINCENRDDTSIDEALTSDVKRMISSFEKPDIALVVSGKRLYINKAELIEKSPVFKTMLTSDFKEKSAAEIELPDKDLQHFLIFLRCTLEGYQDDITEDNVHCIIPIAHEYQVDTTMQKADLFLSNVHRRAGFKNCRSSKIIKGILEAEQYGLTETLECLIEIAASKKYKYFSAAAGHSDITKDTLYKIAMRRWIREIDPITGETRTGADSICVR